MADKNEYQTNKLLNDFILFISENYILDWEYDVSFGNQLISSLTTKSNRLKYLFHLKRGDVLCTILDQKVDESLSPVVWLGAEGIPHNITALNFSEFLELTYFGSGLLYDINSVCFDYSQNKDLTDPEIIYNDERINYALENFSTKEENYELLLEWLKTNGIDKMANPVQYIKRAALSIPID